VEYLAYAKEKVPPGVPNPPWRSWASCPYSPGWACVTEPKSDPARRWP